MAVTFLGYLDGPDEMIQGGKRRCLFGCDGADDVATLPTSEGMTLAGGKTAKPAPFSMALVAGVGTKVLKSDGTWGDL
jgi:hypothetical protein